MNVESHLLFTVCILSKEAVAPGQMHRDLSEIDSEKGRREKASNIAWVTAGEKRERSKLHLQMIKALSICTLK